MKSASTVVTRKGQITLPAEVRRRMGLKRGDRVALVMDGDDIKLVRAGGVVERTAGALKEEGRALSASELREAAERAIAEEADVQDGA